MTSNNEKRMAARRASVRRVRNALEARIQEKLEFACGDAVYQAPRVGNALDAKSANREYGFRLHNNRCERETANSRDLYTTDE